MADKETRKSRPASSSTPEDFPTTSSQSLLPSGDYSYTVEIVMRMQETMGKLAEAVDSLKKQSDKHDEKLDKLSHKVYAAGAVVASIGAIALWFLNKIWDIAAAILAKQ